MSPHPPLRGSLRDCLVDLGISLVLALLCFGAASAVAAPPRVQLQGDMPPLLLVCDGQAPEAAFPWLDGKTRAALLDEPFPLPPTPSSR